MASTKTDADMESRLARVRKLSDWLDTAIRIPVVGYRIGWDTVIGLVPGVGDVATATMSIWVIHEARQLGVSRWTLIRMLGNTTVDTVLGSVPVVGDLFDAAFRSNQKNLKLLEKALSKREGTSTNDGSGAR